MDMETNPSLAWGLGINGSKNFLVAKIIIFFS
jgi:hypothetical protein